jgi:uncharacterized protein YoxC
MPRKKIAVNSDGGANVPVQKSMTKDVKDADNVYFSLAVVAIVLLIIIGVIFGYTKDKINKLAQAQEDSKALATQLQEVTDKLTSLQDKTATLEKMHKENQAIVTDILDKQREIPASVETAGWTLYQNAGGAYQVKLPATWELAQPLMGADSGVEKLSSVVYFQPKANPTFVQVVSVQEDYLDFAALSIKEKYEIFKELKLIDEFDFTSGLGLYFLNLNDKGEQVPTVLFLGKKHIYRMTFNVSDKQAVEYLTFRGDFEKIAATFTTTLESVKK